jgi:hypothetical protein
MQDMRAKPWVVMTVTVLGLAGCAGQAGWNELPAPPAQAGPITGTVLDSAGRPLPDHIVAVGGERTTSDGEGRFTLPHIPAGYDLVIASPDHSRATVYQDLGRRDPVVTHETPRRDARARAHKAQVDVTVTGGEAAKASWHVNFASPRASADLLIKGMAPDAAGVVKPGTLAIEWDGADTITGVVMALLMKEERRALTPWFAQQQVTLRTGETARVQLVLAKVPVVMRPAGKVTLPDGVPPFDTQYHEHFSVPGSGRALHSSYASRREAFAVADLRAFGVELCTEAFQWNPYLRSQRTQCGVDPAQGAVLALPPAPAFTSPAWDTPATPGMRFSWSPHPGAVYRLMLATVGGKPTAAFPQVDIYTAKTTASWPDLSAVGVAFPTGLTYYGVTIAALGPHSSIDDVAVPREAGAAQRRPTDRWKSESQELSVPVRPPLGTAEAACVLPAADVITCGDAPAGPGQRRERYVLSAINDKIRSYPDFANAVNIHCVRDCAEARAFAKAFEDYQQAHPDFDAVAPLPPEPPPPPPPPEMFDKRR